MIASTSSASISASSTRPRGWASPRIADDETRRAVIRGFNIVTADYFRELSDRLTPAAVIPMHTPEEAIDELEFVTKQLGSKVGMFGSGDRRASYRSPRASTRRSPALPCIMISSASTATTITTRSGRNAASSRWRRPSTPAAAASACATRRATSRSTISATSPLPGTPSPSRCSSAASRGASPMCDFGFLEGGVGWGCQLFADLIEHWERRGAKALEYMRPDKLDRPLLRQTGRQIRLRRHRRRTRRRDGWPDPRE